MINHNRIMWKYLFKGLLILILLMVFHENQAQKRNVIKISGVVVDADTVNVVPYVSISVRNSLRGTFSDNSGHFSIFVRELDTLDFSAIGYKKAVFVVPETLKDPYYSLIQLMRREILQLEEVEIIAWPSTEDFVRAFHEIKLPRSQADEIFLAKDNLNDVLRKEYEEDKFYYDQMRYSKLYNTTGIAPPNNFLNPITWTNFIRDWRNGVFKSKK
ncbi:carboxypeptidase-like regulatory domain-containing protein [Fulvivirgaceae bacterium BMA10]|uniref:Carboxypeptidase-like regulatory domain-containing protein n=1 Tax=Splendidivirga corallicola TaxID=3051826 RepID=A0ABT8L097_9BACT|nr:carboxypeptidase-like regulatory domain-containing protein [Fulvivirgaceae bacterium BMA10]